jgi:hypothetical protein
MIGAEEDMIMFQGIDSSLLDSGTHDRLLRRRA